MTPFATHLAQARRLSPATVETYTNGVRMAEKWAEEADAPPVEEWGPAEVSAFLAEGCAHLAAETASSRLSSLRAYYKWMQLQGKRADNPASLVDPPKVPSRMPRHYSEEQVLWVAKQCGPKERDVVLTLWHTAVRASELTTLRFEDVEWIRRTTKSGRREEHLFSRVMGKGSKERYVPFPKQVYNPRSGRKSGSLFGLDNRKQVAYVVKKCSDEAVLAECRGGMEGCGDMSPHKIRASRLVHWLRVEKLSPLVVQALAGHASMDTTLRYCKVDPLAAAWEMYD